MPAIGRVKPQKMKTETVILTISSLQSKDLDAADSANITTQGYVEKYSIVLTPTAWMIANGKNAVLVCEYIIKADPGTGTVSVKTLVDGADTVEKTGLTISSGEQLAVHTDIVAAPLAAGTSYTVSLEAKNSDSGQTSVIDYFNCYLQIGRSGIGAYITVMDVDNIQSLSMDISRVKAQVWSGAVNSTNILLTKDGLDGGLLAEGGAVIEKDKYTLGIECMLGTIHAHVSVDMTTDNDDDPAIMTGLSYNRVWFE